MGLERQLLSAKQGREDRLLRLGASRQEHDHLKHQVKSIPVQIRQLILYHY